MKKQARAKVKLKVAGAAIKLGPRFVRAFEFAVRKHAGQTRKGTAVPYIAHVMGVASLVLEYGGDQDMAIAALLHDVVEDCGGAPVLTEIRLQFGARVARIVDGCTDSDTDPKPPWLERKQRYIRHLRDADDETRLVSAADKLYNVRSISAAYRQIGERVFARFTGGRDGTLWYYRALLDEFERDRLQVVHDLRLAVEELEARVAGRKGVAPHSRRK